MLTLDRLNDRQNHLLTRLSYQSDKLSEYEDKTISQIYSSLSGNQKKSDFGKRLKELVDEDLGTLCIKDTDNSSTGFGAVAFEDYKGNRGFSFRGTDGLSIDSVNDWVDNVIAASAGTSIQTSQAEAFFDKNRDKSGNNYLYGHSKGGQLSESVYVNNYDKIKEVHLLNPQPLNPYSLTPGQKLAINSKQVDIVIVEGDYVWFSGNLPSLGNIRIARNDGGDPHFDYNLGYDEYGNIINGRQPLWEFPAYFLASGILEFPQMALGTVGFAYNCTVRIVDFVKNDLLPAAWDFIKQVGRGLLKFGEKITEFANNLNKFLSSIVERASDWFKKHFNAGYQYATNNPYIQLNTAKLREYANRLIDVNRRIVSLDSRMDGLYTKVGLLDLWNLLQADRLTGFNWKLIKCAGYLNGTADDFENLESLLYRQIGG